MLLKRQEMELDFPDSLATSVQPDDAWDTRFRPTRAKVIRMDSGGKWPLIAISYPRLDDAPRPHRKAAEGFGTFPSEVACGAVPL